jgi:hypothetical protein
MSTTDHRRMTRLWERMAALYGGRWELEYGPCLNGNGHLAPLAMIWGEALADLPNDAIAAGLRACLDGEDRPPSLPKFLRLCGRQPSPRRADPAHHLIEGPPHKLPTESMTTRCARMAENFTEMAQRELAPRLLGKSDDDRKAIVRTYWLSVLSEIGPYGRTLASNLQEQSL